MTATVCKKCNHFVLGKTGVLNEGYSEPLGIQCAKRVCWNGQLK
jgi:hypothetical protein